MSPEVSIVDCELFCAVGFLRTIDKSEFSHCELFCAVGFLRTIDKSEFSHSLDPKPTFVALHYFVRS